MTPARGKLSQPQSSQSSTRSSARRAPSKSGPAALRSGEVAPRHWIGRGLFATAVKRVCPTLLRTCIHMHKRVHVHHQRTYALHVHARARAHMRARTCARTCAHAHAHTHMHTHTHTCAHTHARTHMHTWCQQHRHHFTNLPCLQASIGTEPAPPRQHPNTIPKKVREPAPSPSSLRGFGSSASPRLAAPWGSLHYAALKKYAPIACAIAEFFAKASMTCCHVGLVEGRKVMNDVSFG